MAKTLTLTKKTYVYKSYRGLDLRADVFRPFGSDVRPVIFWLHPGGLIVGDRELLPADQIEAYAAAGYVVVAIDYRLGPQAKVRDMLQDVTDAYAWIRSEGRELYGADPDRIVSVGLSAGGYLALSTGYWLDPRPAAVISYYGFSDVYGPWISQPDEAHLKMGLISEARAFECVGTEVVSGEPGPPHKRGDFWVWCRQNGSFPKLVGGHDPAAELERLKELSPVDNVTEDYPPTVLLHGDVDESVTFMQSASMSVALGRKGVPHEFVTLPGYPHRFERLENGIREPRAGAAFMGALDFVGTYVKQRIG